MSDAPEDETEPTPEAEPEPELAWGVPVTESRGQRVLHPSRDTYLETLGALRADGFVMLADICGVDYLTHPGRELPPGVTPERFEVVVNLLDPGERRRVRLRVQVPADDPAIDSLYALYPGGDASERETYDMFGIEFRGHPDPTRILMPEDWDGHPLRKDYDQGRIPVQFKSATNVR